MKFRLLLIALLLLSTASAFAQEATPEITTETTTETPVEASTEATAETTAEVTAAPTIEFPQVGTFAVRQPFEGRERRYVMTIPESYAESETPVPLLIAMHPASGNGEQMSTISNYSAIAEREGFIVVFPDAVGGAWTDGRVGDPRLVPGVDDVTFIAALIDTLSSSLNIDRSRVYLMGYSMGGMMAFRAGCLLSDRVAAIGSVASTMPQYALPDCEGLENTLPVIAVHGTNDNVVPWLGVITQQGSGYLSILDTAYFWATHNQCRDFSGIEALDDIEPDDGTRVLVETFISCANDAEVQIVGVYRGGHTYPGFRRGGASGGLTTQDISASQVVWEFVSRFSR